MARQIALRRTIELFIEQELAPQAQSARLAAFARASLREVIESGEGSPAYQRFVDGRQGVDEESVAPGGVILYRFAHWAAIVQFAISFLRQRSQKAGGDYAEGFYAAFFTGAEQARGRFVPIAEVNPVMVGPGVVRVIFGNWLPWSRKLDVQIAGKKPIRFRVAPGLFDDCAKEINRRFGALVDARRQYSVDLGARRWVAKTGPRRGKPVESPAIVITMKR
ncbi:hypothetical protein [Niveispirillum sp.]|uniref:hypothetical protein n=1 Tax=Niveispirillum sp. TaxID=1917217 RepID=UPI001B4AE216|nr:hypothetical protein [Niveispirillum sp.]MBP7339085.1 hypothetical protein [Niveispirillum sp.]